MRKRKRSQKVRSSSSGRSDERPRRKPSRTAGSSGAAAIEQPLRSSDGPTVVGIGASAGGLEAFSQVLEALPEEADLALVLVQHLAPQHESALPTLLGGKTHLPVLQVTDGMRVETGHVYVIPPNVQMEISDGTLHLAPRPGDRTQYTPIDFFLRSLALSAGNRAIGVILSGTASDGAIGIREVKAVGGIAIAQEPETARYDGMPRAAIATGMIDLVLPPQAIASELAKIAAHPYVRARWPRRPGDDIALNDDELTRVLGMLRASSGVDFRHQDADHQATHPAPHGAEQILELRPVHQAPAGESGRGRAPLPGHPDPRDALLPRARFLRRAGDTRVPGAVRGALGRPGACVGAGLLDRRGGLFGLDRARGVRRAREQERCADSDLRYRHQRGGRRVRP